MVPAIMPKGRKLDLAAAASLVRPRDSLLCGFVAGQPVGFLEARGAQRPGGHRPLHGAPAAPVRSRAESWGASGEWLLRARRAHGTCGRRAGQLPARGFQRPRATRTASESILQFGIGSTPGGLV